MAVAFVASSVADSGTSGGTTTCTITMPTWTVGANDYGIVIVSVNKNPTSVATPTGWSIISALQTTGGGFTIVFGKALVSGDSGSLLTMTLGTAARTARTARVYSGVSAVDVTGTMAQQATATTSVTTNSITTVAANDLIVTMVGGVSTAFSTVTATWPTGSTNGGSDSTTSTTASNAFAGGWDKAATTAGSYAPGTATASTAIAYNAVSFGLSPVSTGTAATAAGTVTLSGTGTGTASAVASGATTLAGSTAGSAASSSSGLVSLTGTASPGFSASGFITLSGTANGGATAAGSLTLSGAGSPTVVAASAGVIALAGMGGAAGAAVAAGAIALAGAATGGSSSTATAAGAITLAGTATVTRAPLPPTDQPGRARWAWAVGDWHGLPTRQLAAATSRSCKLRLTGTSEVTFTLDGTAPEATAIKELVSDLWVMRNGFTLYRGRVGGATDTLDGTRHTVAVTTGDYRALLARRLLLDADTLTYTSTDAAAIGWSLISTTQGHPGGGLNITDGSSAVGASRTITYPAGQSVGQAVEQLSLMDAGWNWDIVPTTGQTGQVYTTWQSRGISRGKVLDYPGRIASLTRTVDPGNYANAVRETGNSGVAAVTVAASDIATRVEGRWDTQLGDTSLLDAASVTARANYDLAQRQNIVPAYQVKLYPGSWGGPLDVWLGDVVQLSVQSGRLTVDDYLRVWEVDIDLDDADNETVTLTLSDLDPFKRARSRQVEFRLQNLERR